MLTKCRPAGNLFAYLSSAKDMKGLDREQLPIKWRGSTDAAMAVLQAQAPPSVLEKDRSKRWVWHCRRRLIHLMNCFSEKQKKVEQVLPSVMKGTEALVLAGLPWDSLAFVWYEHPQRLGSHTHCGLVRSLLPKGGPYDPRLSAELMQLFDRLAGRRLDLSDPLDPERARLVAAAGVSCIPQNEEPIRKVVLATNELWQSDGLDRHSDFLKLLKRLGFKVLAAPDPDGRGRCLAPESGARAYPNTVTVDNPAGGILCFTGPVCRPDFDSSDWAFTLARRKHEAEELQTRPQKVYSRFAYLLLERAATQRYLYPLDDDRPRVSLADFEWLNPARDREPTPWEGVAAHADDFGPGWLRKTPAAAAPARDHDDDLAHQWLTQPPLQYPFCSASHAVTHELTDPRTFAIRAFLDADLDESDPENWPELLDPPLPRLPSFTSLRRKKKERVAKKDQGAPAPAPLQPANETPAQPSAKESFPAPVTAANSVQPTPPITSIPARNVALPTAISTGLHPLAVEPGEAPADRREEDNKPPAESPPLPCEPERKGKKKPNLAALRHRLVVETGVATAAQMQAATDPLLGRLLDRLSAPPQDRQATPGFDL